MGINGVWWGTVIINWSAVLIAVTYTNYQLKKVEKKKSKTT
jgi:Na+-driven multidrug efflux pump